MKPMATPTRQGLREAAARLVEALGRVARAEEWPTGGIGDELMQARNELSTALARETLREEWLVWCPGPSDEKRDVVAYYLVVNQTDANQPFTDDDFDASPDRSDAYRASSRSEAREMAKRAGWQGFRLVHVRVFRRA